MGLATPHSFLFQSVSRPLKVASPVGLATSKNLKWQVPWDLPFLEFKSGKNQFLPHKCGKYWFLPSVRNWSGKNRGKNQVLATFFMKKWQELWQEPCLNYMGLFYSPIVLFDNPNKTDLDWSRDLRSDYKEIASWLVIAAMPPVTKRSNHQDQWVAPNWFLWSWSCISSGILNSGILNPSHFVIIRSTGHFRAILHFNP